MASRFWFYLSAAIVVVGLLAYRGWATNRIQARAVGAADQALRATQASLQIFLGKQTSAPKLVSLARRLQKNEPALVRPVIEKAYALAPTNPDAVWLESAYHPELKARALQLNPLLDQKINPLSPLGQLR